MGIRVTGWSVGGRVGRPLGGSVGRPLGRSVDGDRLVGNVGRAAAANDGGGTATHFERLTAVGPLPSGRAGQLSYR